VAGDIFVLEEQKKKANAGRSIGFFLLAHRWESEERKNEERRECMG